jgi:hypothetical protein
MKNTKNTFRSLAVMAVALLATAASAATINFSSIETVLANPMDKASKMHAAWVGWQTEVYENNMPFIELANEVGQPAILSFKMTIGDTNYRFANEFKNKAKTNSWDIPANGQFALAGKSTPGIAFTTTTEDNGDTLVLNFGNGGLQAGQRVIFQVDINPNLNSPSMSMFAPYTSVFFNSGAPKNSVITLDYAGLVQDSVVELPNFTIPNGMGVDLSSPRPYNQMQMIPTFPDTEIPPIPEPAGLAIVASGAALLAGRRKAS